MVQRVLIQGGQSAAMTVSLPGIEVTTADCNQTCFDSRWSGLTPFMKGTVQVNGVNGQNAAASVGFGQTLDAPPLFFGYAQTLSPSNGQPLGDFGTTPYMLRGNGIDEWFYVGVGTSSLTFMVNGWGGSILRLTFSLFKRTSG
ncbi:hypothetical protein IVB12_16075 [Bradyrhizobium sp. 179]|uniref:hypothetical protein n=1 Tax=Bradyrhizobium sp. 179 TaxID=2782648 RepID=UPI001FF75329|nr:hypothetical protein [Bradyrhizobium sp. 179]MCK1543435.1 hypothetical protein [Bradyrhizobium sp. 179]